MENMNIDVRVEESISLKLIFLIRTETISNDYQFSFTLQTLATLNA